MSYDSSAMNANPNNTQTPARHDDLPAPTAMNPNGTMEKSGGADYPYVAGGDRPEPASLKPRYGLAAAGRVKESQVGREYDGEQPPPPVPGQGIAREGPNAFGDSPNGSVQRLRGGSARYAEQGLEPPAHKVHRDSEPLPAPGAQREPGFGAIPAQDAPPVHRVHSESEPLPPPGSNAFKEERPLGVQPVREGGVAIDGREGLPEGKATAMDKVVGKTQKVVGKMTKNWDMHEKGELREAGGKKAAAGEARAPHD